VAGTAAVEKGVGGAVFVGVEHVGAMCVMSVYDGHGEKLLYEGQRRRRRNTRKHEPFTTEAEGNLLARRALGLRRGSSHFGRHGG
jgi:hypothetical protein